MGWSIGYDKKWDRDIGYGVPSVCDHPDCNKEIDRGVCFVCGGQPFGGQAGCGLFFCEDHLYFYSGKPYFICERCGEDLEPFEPKPDTKEWVAHKLTDDSWHEWREENTEKVREMTEQLNEFR